jgi:hypothetical protein
MYNYELKIITAFLNTHRNIYALFPKKWLLIHYLILFGSHNINAFENNVLKLKCLAKRMLYMKVDCCHLNPDAKR